MVCNAETKLKGEIEGSMMHGGRYRVWRRDRVEKQGGGVTILVREDISVDKVDVGKGRAEVLKIRISTDRV